MANFAGDDLTELRKSVVKTIEDHMNGFKAPYLPVTPLFFGKITEEDLESYKKETELYSCIVHTFDLAFKYASVDEKGKIQTTQYRKRSVLDIWRHVSTVLPEVTLWDVMHSFYEHRGKLCGWFCWGVMKRVFQTYPNAIQLSSIWLEGQITDQELHDELGLTFDQWENI